MLSWLNFHFGFCTQLGRILLYCLHTDGCMPPINKIYLVQHLQMSWLSWFYPFTSTDLLCSNIEVLWILCASGWTLKKKKGPDKGTLRLRLCTGETASALCHCQSHSAVFSSNMQNNSGNRAIQNILRRMSNFSILGFLLCYSSLGKSSHILKHHEMAGWVCLSLNWTVQTSVWINLLTVFLSRLEATLN